MIPPKPTVVCRNETDPGRFKRASKNVHILKFSAPVVKKPVTKKQLKFVPERPSLISYRMPVSISRVQTSLSRIVFKRVSYEKSVVKGNFPDKS